MSIIDQKPPWTRGALRRLGQALASGTEPPEGCPEYGEVMIWHNELCAEVAAILFTTDWRACPSGSFDVTARPKTIDTLVQKLQREQHMTLDDVQDLAGVRIDADITLRDQTALAQEIADSFGDRSRIRDLRESPHSGYRAVHVWLRLPAGRVEVQIRTHAQSVWANTYERLGDRFGRAIRYDGPADTAAAQPLIDSMHTLSKLIADTETFEDKIDTHRRRLDGLRVDLNAQRPRGLARLSPRAWRHTSKLWQAKRREREVQHDMNKMSAELHTYRAAILEQLNELQRTLVAEGG